MVTFPLGLWILLKCCSETHWGNNVPTREGHREQVYKTHPFWSSFTSETSDELKNFHSRNNCCNLGQIRMPGSSSGASSFLSSLKFCSNLKQPAARRHHQLCHLAHSVPRQWAHFKPDTLTESLTSQTTQHHSLIHTGPFPKGSLLWSQVLHLILQSVLGILPFAHTAFVTLLHILPLYLCVCPCYAGCMWWLSPPGKSPPIL